MSENADFEFKLLNDVALERCVAMLMKQYGNNAWHYADKRMFNLINENDAKGASVWLAIAHEIEMKMQEIQNGQHLKLCVNHSGKI